MVQLVGVGLVPTMSGSVQRIAPMHEGQPLFVLRHGDDAQLLQPLPQLVVDAHTLGPTLTARSGVLLLVFCIPFLS